MKKGTVGSRGVIFMEELWESSHFKGKGGRGFAQLLKVIGSMLCVKG
jgi:hypothetical protein